MNGKKCPFSKLQVQLRDALHKVRLYVFLRISSYVHAVRIGVDLKMK